MATNTKKVASPEAPTVPGSTVVQRPGDVHLNFNYDLIKSKKYREHAQAAARRIKLAYREGLKQIQAIGEQLLTVKAILDDGLYVDWLRGEFEMSVRTAQNYTAVATRLRDPQNATLAFLPKDALYLVASHTVTDEAVAEVVRRLDAGQYLGLDEVRDVIYQHKGKSGGLTQSLAAQVRRFTKTISRLVEELPTGEFDAGFMELEPEHREQAIKALETLLDDARRAHEFALAESQDEEQGQKSLATEARAMMDADK